MSDTDAQADNDINRIRQTTDIVAAFVSHNSMAPGDLPKLISEIYAALKSVSVSQPVAAGQPLVPAVPIKKSITPDFLVCLDDGKQYKSLKRHLSKLGMTPDEYRAKWGLPNNYPMVAPNYSSTRSTLAKTNGLGRKPAAPTQFGKRTRRANAEA
jgi:predicted transcriptional regulator